MQTCPILVIEDDLKIASFVAESLHEQGYRVEQALDGAIGFELAQTNDYAAIILDLMLPGMDGLEIIAGLRACGRITPVIVLSARHSLPDRVKGLELGADDYLVKPFSFAELLARLQAILRRGCQYREPTAFTVGDLTLDLLSRRATRAGQVLELKTNEFVLLEQLMRNSGQIVARQAIVNLIWGYDPGTNVVEVLMSRLRAKVDKDFEPKLIHTVRGLGYVLRLD